jgi:hypothetical protein
MTRITVGDKIAVKGKNSFDTYTVISHDAEMLSEGNWVRAFILASNTKGIGSTWKVFAERIIYQQFEKIG